MNTNTAQPLGPLQKEWVQALRSGSYEQGQGALKRDQEGVVRYCCLGVACDLWFAPKEQGKLKTGEYYYTDYTEFDAKYRAMLNMPESIVGKIATYGPAGVFMRDGFCVKLEVKGYMAVSLVDLNDSCKLTFNEIADFIEENAHLIFHKPV